jgi:hypothetical protein
VTCFSCIASSSAACVFGGVRLISSASSRPAKRGPELEVAGPLVVDERPGDVAGQQVGRELGALEVEPQRLGEAAGRERLAQAGEVLHEHVTAGEDAREHEPQRLPLADDGPVHLVEDGAAQVADAGEVQLGHGHHCSIRRRMGSSRCGR